MFGKLVALRRVESTLDKPEVLIKRFKTTSMQMTISNTYLHYTSDYKPKVARKKLLVVDILNTLTRGQINIKRVWKP